VTPCNEIAKYFYTGAHPQCVGYNAVVEVFFHHASKWSKWCAQTLHPFSHILKISSRIGAPIVAPPSDNFQICFIPWKGLLFHKKICKPHLNRPTNADAMSCGNNSTAHQSGRRPTALFSIYKINKNLAIANRSRVSCINTNNNTMTLKSGLEVTQGH